MDGDNSESKLQGTTPLNLPLENIPVEFDELMISEEDNAKLISLNDELVKILDIKNTLSTPPPSIDLSPLECHALQHEEVEVLRAIFDEDVSLLNDNGTCFCVKIKFLSEEIKEDDVIRIWFSLPPNYPCVPPVFEIETNKSGSFTFSEADNLFDQLMQTAITRLGGTMIYDLIIMSQDYMQEIIKKKKETISSQEIREDRTIRTETETTETETETIVTGTGAEKTEVIIKECDYYRPKQFVGSISDIISKLPSNVQITRIENILRQDLADRFQSCHKTMVNEMWQKERKLPQMYCLQPQVAFHGTLSRSLPSIVQHGLVIPGKDNKIKVRCGSSLGVGIYLSPDPTFSLSYTDSSRLIVCAALLGRMFKGCYDTVNKDRFSMFISSSEMEWVFFNAAQVLPCYVIQVKVHDTPGQHMKMSHPPPLISLLPDKEVDDEGEKEKQAKLLARARKYLPYGFGPGRAVILEAAEIDDDEEDYGDFQLLRYGNEEVNHHSDVHEEQTELQDYRYKDRTDWT